MDINAPVLLEPLEHTLAHAVAASRPPRSQTPDQGSSRPGAVRIGLVCMMRDPPALRTWLRHYADTLRVERFYILADDSPGPLWLLHVSAAVPLQIGSPPIRCCRPRRRTAEIAARLAHRGERVERREAALPPPQGPAGASPPPAALLTSHRHTPLSHLRSRPHSALAHTLQYTLPRMAQPSHRLRRRRTSPRRYRAPARPA